MNGRKKMMKTTRVVRIPPADFSVSVLNIFLHVIGIIIQIITFRVEISDNLI